MWDLGWFGMLTERIGRALLVLMIASAAYAADTVWAQAPSKLQESGQAQTTTEGKTDDAKTVEPKSPAAVDPAPPAKGFKPSEKIRADSAVSFPVDI